MRTKALLCAAALAAGIVASVAQSNVYSINAVGYYNVTIPASKGLLIANQFNTTNNSIGALFPAGPVNSLFSKWITGTGFITYQFDEYDSVWYPDALASLNPGEGGFFRNPNAAPLTLTFVGEVPQGALSTTIPSGNSIRASQVPQAGTVTALGFPEAVNDRISLWDADTGYVTAQFDEYDSVWYPSVPTLAVGQSFFLFKESASTWTRNFTVQ